MIVNVEQKFLPEIPNFTDSLSDIAEQFLKYTKIHRGRSANTVKSYDFDIAQWIAYLTARKQGYYLVDANFACDFIDFLFRNKFFSETEVCCFETKQRGCPHSSVIHAGDVGLDFNNFCRISVCINEIDR